MSDTAVAAAAEIDEQPLDELLPERFVKYGLFVVEERAIPSVFDGFKPSARQILWAAWHENLLPSRDYEKLQRWIGAAMSTFYPSGDNVDKVVHNLQLWHKVNVPFVDGKGAWGGPDIPVSAARYIDGRMSEAGLAVVKEIPEDAVPMRLNYDGKLEEPTLLPVAFPNILVNPTSGIAVGFATKIPSFNLKELAKVAEHLLDNNREIDFAKLRKLLPGPDFPMGGQVYCTYDDLRGLYFDGSARIEQFAPYTVRKGNRGKTVVSFTNLPHDVAPSKVIARVNKLIDAGSPLFDSAVTTSKAEHGIEIEVTLPKGVPPESAVPVLYDKTPLGDGFSANMNVLGPDKVPMQLGVVDMINHWLDFRFETVCRVREFRKAKAEARSHIVSGMLLVTVDIDKAIKIIRGADAADEARAGLMKTFKLDEVQANYVLDRTLRSLTRSDVIKLEKEAAALAKTIKELNAILKSKDRQKKVILAELSEAVEQFGWDRRTAVLDRAPIVGGKKRETRPNSRRRRRRRKP